MIIRMFDCILKSLMLLVMEVGECREVEVVGVGDVVRGLFAGLLCGAMSILMVVACAYAMPMVARYCNSSTSLGVVCMPGGMGQGCPCV
jgi:hypothetical protein